MLVLHVIITMIMVPKTPTSLWQHNFQSNVKAPPCPDSGHSDCLAWSQVVSNTRMHGFFVNVVTASIFWNDIILLFWVRDHRILIITPPCRDIRMTSTCSSVALRWQEKLDGVLWKTWQHILSLSTIWAKQCQLHESNKIAHSIILFHFV